MNARRLIMSMMLAFVTLWIAGATEAATRARTRGEPVLNDPVVRLAAGGGHTCQVNGDGTVRCWGFNNLGQLGDGTTTNRVTPVTVAGITNAVAVTAGQSHTCALLATGSPRCWGGNDFGQLGDGTIVSRPTPGPVTGLSNIVAITAGAEHTCALLANGSVHCWGGNVFGQLGDGTTVDRSTSGPVSGVASAVALAAGGVLSNAHHTCALLTDGSARCWGSNFSGQLGDGTTTNRSTPVSVSGLANALTIAAGDRHTCALLATGGGRCWGRNDVGQLGDGTTTNRLTPVPVSGLTNAVALATGGAHSCALVADGTARCWGAGDAGRLGDGSFVGRITPVSVSGLVNAVAITAGKAYSCALLVDGSARCWGFNNLGQLGNGTTVSSGVPTTVAGGGGSITARDIAASDFRSCAVRANGTAACWGGILAGGFLGNGTTTGSLTPVTVSGLVNAVAVTAARDHMCALLANGRARCWGGNNSGQLGDGTTTTRLTPVPVVGLTNAVAITAGRGHTCALLANGRASCWGGNNLGQLGDGTTATRLTPVTVSGLTNAMAVAAGANHTCALLADGGVHCWGFNFSGQVGDGTTVTRLTPSPVNGLSGNVVAITASERDHTCALLVDGTARCWGGNSFGGLGDGTTTQRSLPTTVLGLSNAVAISAGGGHGASGELASGHTCALVNDGGARCWGANSVGQLGDGTTTDRLTPTVVTAQFLASVTSFGLTTRIAAGSHHTCALQASGALRCWGLNDRGQLGDGTTVNKLRPTGAPSVPSFTLNIDPTVTLDHNTREATVTILALCDEGQDLHVDVTLTQGGVSGQGTGGGECTGGLARFPMTVTAQGSDEFELDAALGEAVGVISEGGVVVDNQEWTRAVQIVGPAPTLEGRVTAVGAGKDTASVRLKGQFTAGSAIALDQATLTISALLDEADGAGELVRGNGGATLLPLTLGARAGSTPTAAIYQTATGVRPVVWAEVKNRDPETGRIEFSIKVDRATIPVGPALCSTGSPSATELTTQFNLQVGTGAPVGVEVVVPWQCLGTELRTP